MIPRAPGKRCRQAKRARPSRPGGAGRSFSGPGELSEERWFVYILQCEGGRLYTGMTNNLEKRLCAHRAGRGGRFTRAFRVQAMLHAESFRTRGEALSREAGIKKLTREEKTALIAVQRRTLPRGIRRLRQVLPGGSRTTRV